MNDRPPRHVFHVAEDANEGSGSRLDRFVAEHLDDLSRTRARDLIVEGSVLVAGRPSRPSYRVQAGDEITLDLPPLLSSTLVPEKMPLSISYEDADMLVLDKPPGIAVHPAPGHAVHTLVHGLLARYPDLPGIGGTQRPGIVHRLDLDTSGLLMVAKSERGMSSLSAQLEARTVKKGYLALLKGRLAAPDGVIDAPIGRDPVHRQQMAVVRDGREARTRYHQLAVLDGLTLVLAQPETGRTHQIRVHFAAAGAPVAGDELYGGQVDFLNRQFLHAAFLRFARPSDGEPVELYSPLPDDLTSALSGLLTGAGKGLPALDRSIARMLGLAEKHFRSE